MTLKELSEHPEMANPKEIDAINDVIQEIKKRVKYLCGLTEGITLDSGREPDDIAESFYQEGNEARKGGEFRTGRIHRRD